MAKFSQPDGIKPEVKTEVQEQKAPVQPQNEPKGTAHDANAFDLSDFVQQPREAASTGHREKLEANDYNDPELLKELGYDKEADPDAPETVEAETVPRQTEISDEWLEIFAWAGVELTDEIMPQLLKWLHAENDHQRFKLPPTRRDKLKLAWIVFLRTVLPAFDDKQGLIAVIVMMYIENLVVGVYKLFGRIVAGTFTWPFKWMQKKRKQAQQPIEPIAQQQPEPQRPEPPRQPMVIELPPEQTKAPEFPKPAPKAEEVKQAPVRQLFEAPTPVDVNKDTRQDPITNELFAPHTGHPKQDWTRISSKNGHEYKCKAATFKGQSGFQTWLRQVDYYNTKEQIEAAK